MVREEDEGWEESTGWRLESRLKGRGGCKGQNDKYKNIRNTTMERSYSVDPSRIQVDSLEMAGKMLEKQMTKDNSFPSLLDLTGILPEAQSSTLSGLSERDYPSANSIPGGNDNVSHLALYDKVFIPPEVVEHFGHMQCNCTMGLFAEISRAWLTIDSDIYVWTYENGNDVAFFDGLGESIISVGLVKPKSGVFNTFVRHLLVLTTLSEIIVLGVTFSSKSTGTIIQSEEMHLLGDPIFVVPTDGVAIKTIAGTDSGRLFLGGLDGSLFELVYQISIDNSRHILFTLTDKGAIEVYDLGSDGNSAIKVTSFSQNTIAQYAVQAARTLEVNIFRPIVSISALEKKESLHYNLVAITETGVRLYFTTYMNNISSRPSNLKLLHVRLPPGFTANTPNRCPSKVHTAVYNNGSCVLVTAQEADVDSLWYLSNDLFPFHPYLTEVQSMARLDGTVWAISDKVAGNARSMLRCMNYSETFTQLIFFPPQQPVYQQQQPPYQQNTNFQDYQLMQQQNFYQQQQRLMQQQQQLAHLVDPPLVVRQFYEQARKYVILTSQGVELYKKLRPVDLLQQLLIIGNGPDNDSVKKYFEVLGPDQACANCLILACLDNTTNSQVSDWATRAFFLYGGDPQTSHTPRQPLMSPPAQRFPSGFNPGAMSTPVHPTTGAGTTQHQTNMITPNQPINSILQYSPKHDGLYLYVGRILRPIWNFKVVYKSTLETNVEILNSTIPAEDCALILGHLHALSGFLEKNSQFSLAGVRVVQLQSTLSMSRTLQDSLDNSQQPQRGQRTVGQEALIQEKNSLTVLKEFISNTREVLGLWKILCEHQFHFIADSLTKEQQNQLALMTFRNLILVGQELCSLLINNIINRYLNDNASVDAISTKLREVCPNLYKSEDAACSKANEMLLTAKNLQNKEEREEKLKEALEWFSSVQYYQGVLELVMVCASRVDTKNVALDFYKNNEPSEDLEGFNALFNRMRCYKELIQVLDQIMIQSQPSASPNITISPRAPVGLPIDINTVTPQDADLQVKNLVDKVLESHDELFHVAIYDWMRSHHLDGELIKVCQPSLELYLTRATQSNPDDMRTFDLLWKFYERTNNHAAAARILNKLATTPGNLVNLDQRIFYLARALMCLRGDKIGYAPHLGLFLRELEDRLDIGYIQQKPKSLSFLISRSNPTMDTSPFSALMAQLANALVVLSSTAENGEIEILISVTNQRAHNRLAEEAIEKLNNNLYDLTELYENFAEPFSLWEAKLSIIHSAGHLDMSLIEKVWLKLIESELRNCGSMSGNDKMSVLMNKVKYLGQEYSLSPRCFPLEFLIHNLEVYCCRLKANPSQVHSTMSSLGVPLVSLMKIYERLFEAKDRCWFLEGDEYHLARVIADLTNSFANNPTVVPLVERRMAAAKAGDLISSCLTTLYSRPDTNELVELLRGIHAKINRMH
uniref:Nuclear pore complex protein Nup155 n=1 Tax=Timema douglasi TaxID=61478 RepID=A0A7R8V8H8_TIMDO|nr:unnamed protein product [Timema douglasi]